MKAPPRTIRRYWLLFQLLPNNPTSLSTVVDVKSISTAMAPPGTTPVLIYCVPVDWM